MTLPNRATAGRTGARVRSDSQPWYRQFWPWFLIALPLTSVVFSFLTLYIAVREADEVLPHEGDSTSYSAPRDAVPTSDPRPVQEGQQGQDGREEHKEQAGQDSGEEATAARPPARSPARDRP